ncbi:MAG: hypothetical protein AAFP78_16735, partial [Pseudomonadota bacterium]
IALSTTLNAQYASEADGYRSEMVTMALTYLTGLAATFAFWLNLEARERLFPAFAVFASGLGAGALTFQLYWWRYLKLADEMAQEFRQEAVKLIIGERQTPFSPEYCPNGAVGWILRKRRETIGDWHGVDADACVSAEPSLWVWSQVNGWSGLIIASCVGVLAAAAYVRTSNTRS